MRAYQVIDVSTQVYTIRCTIVRVCVRACVCASNPDTGLAQGGDSSRSLHQWRSVEPRLRPQLLKLNMHMNVGSRRWRGNRDYDTVSLDMHRAYQS